MKCRLKRHFIRVFTICQSTCLSLSRMKGVKSMPNFEHFLQLRILHLPGVRIAYEKTVKLLCRYSIFNEPCLLFSYWWSGWFWQSSIHIRKRYWKVEKICGENQNWKYVSKNSWIIHLLTHHVKLEKHTPGIKMCNSKYRFIFLNQIICVDTQKNHLNSNWWIWKYSKTCFKRPLKNRQNNVLNGKWLLNESRKYCRMLPLEHSAIL